VIGKIKQEIHMYHMLHIDIFIMLNYKLVNISNRVDKSVCIILLLCQ